MLDRRRSVADLRRPNKVENVALLYEIVNHGAADETIIAAV
jgi:hypothetical protein